MLRNPFLPLRVCASLFVSSFSENGRCPTFRSVVWLRRGRTPTCPRYFGSESSAAKQDPRKGTAKFHLLLGTRFVLLLSFFPPLPKRVPPLLCRAVRDLILLFLSCDLGTLIAPRSIQHMSMSLIHALSKLVMSFVSLLNLEYWINAYDGSRVCTDDRVRLSGPRHTHINEYMHAYIQTYVLARRHARSCTHVNART